MVAGKTSFLNIFFERIILTSNAARSDAVHCLFHQMPIEPSFRTTRESSIRHFIERMVYKETYVSKLHAIQNNWDTSRAIIVSRTVIINIRKTNIEEYDVGIRHHSKNKATPTHVAIRRMETALNWSESQSDSQYPNTMISCFYDPVEVSWFCIDSSTREIDRSVPT